MFGMNRHKILKCFRKEKRDSRELSCLTIGLICSTCLYHQQDDLSVLSRVVLFLVQNKDSSTHPQAFVTLKAGSHICIETETCYDAYAILGQANYSGAVVYIL